jgi:hypothetical protein
MRSTAPRPLAGPKVWRARSRPEDQQNMSSIQKETKAEGDAEDSSACPEHIDDKIPLSTRRSTRGRSGTEITAEQRHTV